MVTAKIFKNKECDDIYKTVKYTLKDLAGVQCILNL